jgi:hypothetical protein
MKPLKNFFNHLKWTPIGDKKKSFEVTPLGVKKILEVNSISGKKNNIIRVAPLEVKNKFT